MEVKRVRVWGIYDGCFATEDIGCEYDEKGDYVLAKDHEADRASLLAVLRKCVEAIRREFGGREHSVGVNLALTAACFVLDEEAKP